MGIGYVDSVIVYNNILESKMRKKKAEKQARAIYASGYKEKK